LTYLKHLIPKKKKSKEREKTGGPFCSYLQTTLENRQSTGQGKRGKGRKGLKKIAKGCGENSLVLEGEKAGFPRGGGGAGRIGGGGGRGVRSSEGGVGGGGVNQKSGGAGRQWHIFPFILGQQGGRESTNKQYFHHERDHMKSLGWRRQSKFVAFKEKKNPCSGR